MATPTLQLPQGKEPTIIECPFCGGTMLVGNDKFECFSCFKSGDIVDFLVERDGISHKKADRKSERIKPSIEAKNEIFRANKLAMKYFEDKLDKNKYLSKRAVSDDSIKAFHLGFAPFDGEGLKKYLLNNRVRESVLVQSGLFNSELKPFFRNRVMFPVFDEKGRVAGFGGRRIDDNKESPKYINSPENMVFHKKDILYGLDKAVGNDTVYLVEGYMDVISLHQAGITNAVAALGTAVGVRHCTLLRELGVKKIILALDSDEPGIKSALKTVPILKKYFDVKVIHLESAKDPDEYIKKNGVEKFRSLKQSSGDSFLVCNSEEKDRISLALNLLLQ